MWAVDHQKITDWIVMGKWGKIKWSEFVLKQRIANVSRKPPHPDCLPEDLSPLVMVSFMPPSAVFLCLFPGGFPATLWIIQHNVLPSIKCQQLIDEVNLFESARMMVVFYRQEESLVLNGDTLNCSVFTATNSFILCTQRKCYSEPLQSTKSRRNVVFKSFTPTSCLSQFRASTHQYLWDSFLLRLARALRCFCHLNWSPGCIKCWPFLMK